MFENKEDREVSDLGRYGLVWHIAQKFQNMQNTLFEDAVACLFQKTYSLHSSEIFTEGVHFDLSYFPLKHLGYKTVTAAVSNILAMNGTPLSLSIHLSASNRFQLNAIEELSEGMQKACVRYGLSLSYLDISSSPKGLQIFTSVQGKADEKKIVFRKGAENKELICISGDLGAAYTALLLLEREKRVFLVNPNEQPDLERYSYLLERQLKPEARMDITAALAEHKILPTSMINVNEGLAAALIQLCRASDKGCVIYENKLPIDLLTFQTLRDLKIVATMAALSGGEDYELLFTIKQEDYEKLKKIKNISVIGYIQEAEAGKYLITNDEQMIELKAQGFPKE